MRPMYLLGVFVRYLGEEEMSEAPFGAPLLGQILIW